LIVIISNEIHWLTIFAYICYGRRGPASGRLIRHSNHAEGSMTRVTRRSWTQEQIDLLLAMIDKGVSPMRASVALGRPKLAVQNKARQLGKPFPDVRDVRAARLAREARELEAIQRGERTSRAAPQSSHGR
jgi:hypothetical protein